MTSPEATVDEEYQLWRENCASMYDEVTELVLTWPSLTFEFLQGNSKEAIVGTYTNGEDSEAVLRIKPGAGNLPEQFVRRSWPHEGEVNRARVSPHAPVIATINEVGRIFLFGLESDNFAVLHANIGGYGLAWDPEVKGRLATGVEDGSVAIWQIDLDKSALSAAKKLVSLTLRTSVNDVAWTPTGRLLAAGEDGKIYVFDVDSRSIHLVLMIKCHEAGVNSLASNPFAPDMVATVSSDKTVALWDLRTPDEGPLHVFCGHEGNVTSVKWSPHDDGIFATSGEDRRVIIWDIRRIGLEQTQEDAEDGAPELLFMHGGHTSTVTDFAWHPDIPWLLGSVADDNVCQIWMPSARASDREKRPKVPPYLL